MVYYCKKYLSLLLTIALINSSIQPLYASFPDPEDEVVRKAGAQARLDMWEEKLQNQLCHSAAALESWTPSFIKKAVAKIGNLLESTLKDLPPAYFAKSPLDIAYGHDRVYWLAHFSSAVDEIKDKGLSRDALQAKLIELQNMVFDGVLSPYVYEKGLKELEESGLGNHALFKTTREDFKSALKYAPDFIDETFRREVSLYIKDLQTGCGDAQEFISHIRYYRDIDNALDYKNTLTAIRSYLRENKKALKIMQKDYDGINAAINKEIGRIAKDEKKRLQSNQAFSVVASSELPYFGQEWQEIDQPTNNSIAELLKEKGSIEGYLDTSTKALRKLVHTGAKYAQEHPTQTLMMALATQVAAAAAYNTFASAKQKEESSMSKALPRDKKGERASLYPRAVDQEFQINTETSGNQDYPSVATLSDGNAFVVWNGLQTGNIYGRIFNGNGTAVTDEFRINQGTNAEQYPLAVTALVDGNAFIVWEGAQGGDFDIWARIFNGNGTAVSSEFRINQGTSAEQYIPVVTPLNNGNAFIAWGGAQSGNSDIYGRIVSGNGTAVSDEFLINEITIANQMNPSLTTLNNNDVFVVWDGDQNIRVDVYGRILSENGTAVSPEFRINQMTNLDQMNPSVTTLSNNDAFVVWEGNQNGLGNLYGCIVSENGTVLNSEFSINQFTSASQFNPSIALLENKDVLVVWDGYQDPLGDIYGRVMDGNGMAVTDEFRINDVTTSNQFLPSVTAMSNNKAFVVWTGFQNGTSDIYGRVLSNATIMTSTTSITHLVPLDPLEIYSNNDEIIIPVAVVGGTALIVAGGAGCYIYRRQKRSATSSSQALELTSVPSSIEAPNTVQHSNEVKIKTKEDSKETQEPITPPISYIPHIPISTASSNEENETIQVVIPNQLISYVFCSTC